LEWLEPDPAWESEKKKKAGKKKKGIRIQVSGFRFMTPDS